jgi:hypothetical protein
MVLIIVVIVIVVLLGILVKINFADTDVSVPVRIIVSGLILFIFAAGVYYLVTPDAFQSKMPEAVTDTIAKVDTTKKVSEVIAPVKNPVQPQKQVIDTANKKAVVAAPNPAKVDTVVTPKVETAKSETSKDNQEIIPVQNTGDTSQFDNYKVKLKAYFYNRPDESSRRSDFLFFFNSIPLSALDERNGFIQVSFKTNRNKRYEGWLRKSDLVSADE